MNNKRKLYLAFLSIFFMTFFASSFAANDQDNITVVGNIINPIGTWDCLWFHGSNYDLGCFPFRGQKVVWNTDFSGKILAYRMYVCISGKCMLYKVHTSLPPSCVVQPKGGDTYTVNGFVSRLPDDQFEIKNLSCTLTHN